MRLCREPTLVAVAMVMGSVSPLMAWQVRDSRSSQHVRQGKRLHRTLRRSGTGKVSEALTWGVVLEGRGGESKCTRLLFVVNLACIGVSENFASVNQGCTFKCRIMAVPLCGHPPNMAPKTSGRRSEMRRNFDVYWIKRAYFNLDRCLLL